VEKGQITLRLCGREGAGDRAVRKREGELFRAARKAKWGDSFP
jgi:ribosomal protein RSM22 (predicted rRNA methylase)